MYSPRRFFDLHPESSVVMPRTIPNDLDDLPEAGRNLAAFRRAEFERIVKEGKWRDCVRAYMAAISFADFMAGEILDSLARSPHRTNTIVVLLSDNGWHLGEKEHFHKSTLWRRSTHVPLIISGPGIKRPGAARTQPVSHLDVYPTLTDLCGLDRPGVLDGISLRPLLENPRASRGPAVVTFGPSNFAVLKGRWRLIRYAGGGEELYDDTADPDNFHNLASRTDHDSIRAELRAHVPVNVAPPVPSRTEFDFDFASHTYRRKG
jgi:arylsulfatase A-like enzyme